MIKKGVEMAIATMQIGEHALITIDNDKYSYGKTKIPKGCPTFKG